MRFDETFHAVAPAGLAIKRWMVLFSAGILLLVFGATLILNYQISESWKKECWGWLSR